MFRLRKKVLLQWGLILLMCVTTFACKSDKASNSTANRINVFNENLIGESIVSPPSTSFASYIAEYSGGLQSRKTPITIKLAVPVNYNGISKKINEKLFKIEPKLKGQVKWLDEFTVQYIPEGNLLGFAKNYKVSFKLAELFPNTQGMGEFSFSQYTYPGDWTLNLSNIWTTSKENQLSYRYELTTSDYLDFDKLESCIAVNQEGVNLDFKLVKGTSNNFYIDIPQVDKLGSSSSLKITIDGDKLGISKKIEKVDQIPANKVFSLMSYRPLTEGDNGCVFYFSDNLEPKNYLNTIHVLDLSSKSDVAYSTGVNKNQLKVYFKRQDIDSVQISLFENIYNQNSKRLSNSGDYKLVLKDSKLNPSVKFSSNGIILPDSKNRILTFKASALKAIDLQVVKVYATNLKNFLQINSFTSNNNLKQVGRLVFKQTISLEELASKSLTEEQEFALDLNKLFKQEAGALYYLALSFKPSYTLIEDFTDLEEDLRIKKITPLSTSIEKWDSGYNYYGDLLTLSISYDWSKYRWEDRSDPYTLTFYMDNNNVSATTYAYATRLGVTVKENLENKLWLAVNDILTTKPVGNVKLVAYNYQLQKIGESSTDVNGFASIDCKDNLPFIVSAELEKDITYVKTVQGEQLQISRFDVDGTTSSNGLKGYIYGERGVWRPGDSINVGFIVEDLENRLPKDHPAIFELYNPRGQFYTKQVASSTGHGMYVFKVATKQDDPTGVWDGYVKLGGSSFYKAFKIEAIKPNRLKVDLSFDKEVLESDLSNGYTLNARWLTGAVASNLTADIELSLTKLTNPFPKYNSYVFTNNYSNFSPENIKIFDGTLSSQGNVKSNFRLPKYNNAPGVLKGTCFTRVYEPGGERSINTKDIKVSPFKSYVGVLLSNGGDSWFYETDIAHKVELINLDINGKAVKSNRITYKLYKLSWSWWYDRSKSKSNFMDNKHTKLITEGEVITDNTGRTNFVFQVNYPDYGYYIVAVKDEASKHTVYKDLYIDWPYWRGTSNKTEGKGITTFDFKVDKPTYEVGEEINATLPPLKNGRALISIETGNRVVQREWIETKENEATVVSFKATKEFLPNIYMFVSLFQPHDQTINDSPIRMYGVTPINISDKNTKLAPKLSVPEVIEPQKEFIVKVSEEQGKEMTYTLAIVDDGLLDLTNFKTPNAWSSFFAKEALKVQTWDMYDDVIGALNTSFDKLYRVGGDENMDAADAKANRFNPVVRVEGPFTLKAGKTGEHRITLPMYVGSVRVMAVAAGKGAYGSAEASSFVKSPLMLISSLPRVLSIGEDVWVPINVFALEEGVSNVKLQVLTSENIVIDGEHTRNLNFTNIGDKLQYFHFKVGKNIGIEKVKFVATSGKYKAVEEIEIDVRNPNPQIIEMQSRILAKNETAKLDYNFDIINNDQKLDLTVSTIPPFNLSKRLNFLSGYIHGCTEQITSRALPLLYLPYLQDLSPAEKERVDITIDATIKELYSRQTREGGFVYWPGSSYNSPWATQYAGMFLIKAKELGYNVNNSVLDKFKVYLDQFVTSNGALNISSTYLQAYSLYVLALANKPNLSAMNRLNDVKELSSSTLWILSSAYAIAGNTKVANELVYRASKSTSTDSYYYYGSEIRDIALKLNNRVLLKDKKEAFKLAKKLTEAMIEESYYQTQSTAFAVASLGEYSKLVYNSEMLDFSLGIDGKDNTVVQSGKTVSHRSIEIKNKSGSISINNNVEGTIYIELLQYKTVLKDTYPAKSNGIEMRIVYTDMDNNNINLNSLKQGDDFYASVYVTNTSNEYQENIALTHLIPANCELYGTSNYVLSNGALYPQSIDYQDIRDDKVMTYFNLNRGQTRCVKVKLQVVYAGSFIVPAIQAEVMYKPEIMGRTKASEMSIKLD